MAIKISEFVKEALLEITKGVVEARENADVTISPGAIEGQPIFDANEVFFEINVEVIEGSKVSGDAEAGGSFLSVVKASTRLDGEKSRSSSSSQKITFTVPVHFNSDNVRKK